MLSATPEDIAGLVQELVLLEKHKDEDKTIHSILGQSERIYVARLVAAARVENYDGVVICDEKPEETTNEPERPNHRNSLSLNCGPGKLGSRALRAELSRVPPFILAITSRTPSPKLLFSCATGTDLSVGVALVVLCLFFNDDRQSYSSKSAISPFSRTEMLHGKWPLCPLQRANRHWADTLVPDGTTSAAIDKSFIRRRLAWITSAKPDANPSRSTLQAVNSFLIERPVP